MKRCLFAHSWVIKPSELRSAVPYRTCIRCGSMQRGIYDAFWRDITWETIRERAYSTPVQIQVRSEPLSQWKTVPERAYVTPEKIGFVRKPTSRLDQWAHALRLRRTRVSDKAERG